MHSKPPIFTYRSLSGVVPCLALFVSCTPTVRVIAPDPVKIDVNMNVNITSPPMPGTGSSAAGPSLAERRRMRMGEVQGLKNGHIIGENRDGYLSVVEPPADAKYKSYAEGVVKEENNDRTQLYLNEAKQRGKPLELVEQDYARQWNERAYPGEYIQSADGTWSKK